MVDHLSRLAQSLGLQHLLLDPGSLENLEKLHAAYGELILAQRLIKTSLHLELQQLQLQPHKLQKSKKIKNRKGAIYKKLQMTENFFAMAALSLGQREDYLNMQGQFAEPTRPALLPLPVPYPYEMHCVPLASHPIMLQHHLSLAQYQFQPDLLQPTIMPPLYQSQDNLMSSVLSTPENSTQNLKSQFPPTVKPLGAIVQQPEVTLTQSTTSHNVIQYSVSQTQHQSEQNLQLPQASLMASPQNLLNPLMPVRSQQNSQKPQVNQPQYANFESVRQELTLDLSQANLQETPLITPIRAAPENLICSLISEPRQYDLQQPQISQTQFATLENVIAKLQSELPQQNFQQPEISQTQFATLENVITKLQSQQNFQLPEMSQAQFTTLENLIAKLRSERPQQRFQQPEINQTQFATLENLIRKLQFETHQQNLQEPEIYQTQFATLENMITKLQTQNNFQPEISPSQLATLENVITKLQSEPYRQNLQQSETNQTQFATLENLITKLQSQQYFQQPEISQTQLATLENLIQKLQSEPSQQNFREPEISQAQFATLENVIKNLKSLPPPQPETSQAQCVTLENMTDIPDQNIVTKIRSAIIEKLRKEMSNDSPQQNMELNQISSTESLIKKLTFGTSQSNLEIPASPLTHHRSYEQCLHDSTLPLIQQKGSVRESKFGGDVWQSLGSNRVPRYYRQVASSSLMSATNAGGPEPPKKSRQRGKRKISKTDDKESSYDAYGSWHVLNNECDVQSENKRLVQNIESRVQNNDRQTQNYERRVQDRERNTHNFEQHVQSYERRVRNKERRVKDRERNTHNYEQQVQTYERRDQNKERQVEENNQQQVQNYEEKPRINKWQFHIIDKYRIVHERVFRKDWVQYNERQAQNYE